MGGEVEEDVGPEVGPSPLAPLSTYQFARANKGFLSVWAGSVVTFLMCAFAWEISE